MIVTKEELQAYTGVEFEDGNNIAELFIGSAQNVLENYLGYEVESKEYTKHFALHTANVIKTGIKNITDVEEITVNGVAVEDFYIDDDKIILSQPVISDNIIVKFTAGFGDDLPSILKLTVMRIAAILQTESNNNIGVTSKSFVNEGTRTFTNFTNFDRYLTSCASYRILR